MSEKNNEFQFDSIKAEIRYLTERLEDFLRLLGIDLDELSSQTRYL